MEVLRNLKLVAYLYNRKNKNKIRQMPVHALFHIVYNYYNEHLIFQCVSIFTSEAIKSKTVIFMQSCTKILKKPQLFAAQFFQLIKLDILV